MQLSCLEAMGANALVDMLRPLLLGEDPLLVVNLWQRLKGKVEILGLQWGGPGPVYHVLSGINVALWDIAARAARVPLYRYLGGAEGTAVPVYASGLGPDGAEALAAHYLELGVRAFKLKVGFDPELDVRNVRALRTTIGVDARLMLDANQGWSPDEAIGLLTRLSEYNIFWMEEPVRCDDLEGMRRVRNASKIPIAAGENLYGMAAAQRVLDQEAVDILQPDPTKTAGITESRLAVQMALSRGKRCALHFLGSAVGLVASLHFAAASEGVSFLELDANPNPLRQSLLTEALTIRDGALLISQDPGLGVSLDHDAVQRFRVDH